MRRAVAALLSAALLGLGAAPAAAVPADRVELNRALTAAEHFWRHDPHLHDCTLAHRRARIHFAYANGYNAETFDGGSCAARVLVDPEKTRQHGRARFCRTITHEYGHMLGHHHVSNPSNIMYYDYTPQSVPKACHYPDPHGPNAAARR